MTSSNKLGDFKDSQDNPIIEVAQFLLSGGKLGRPGNILRTNRASAWKEVTTITNIEAFGFRTVVIFDAEPLNPDEPYKILRDVRTMPVLAPTAPLQIFLNIYTATTLGPLPQTKPSQSSYDIPSSFQTAMALASTGSVTTLLISSGTTDLQGNVTAGAVTTLLPPSALNRAGLAGAVDKKEGHLIAGAPVGPFVSILSGGITMNPFTGPFVDAGDALYVSVRDIVLPAQTSTQTVANVAVISWSSDINVLGVPGVVPPYYTGPIDIDLHFTGLLPLERKDSDPYTLIFELNNVYGQTQDDGKLKTTVVVNESASSMYYGPADVAAMKEVDMQRNFRIPNPTGTGGAEHVQSFYLGSYVTYRILDSSTGEFLVCTGGAVSVDIRFPSQQIGAGHTVLIINDYKGPIDIIGTTTWVGVPSVLKVGDFSNDTTMPMPTAYTDIVRSIVYSTFRSSQAIVLHGHQLVEYMDNVADPEWILKQGAKDSTQTAQLGHNPTAKEQLNVDDLNKLERKGMEPAIKSAALAIHDSNTGRYNSGLLSTFLPMALKGATALLPMIGDIFGGVGHGPPAQRPGVINQPNTAFQSAMTDSDRYNAAARYESAANPNSISFLESVLNSIDNPEPVTNESVDEKQPHAVTDVHANKPKFLSAINGNYISASEPSAGSDSNPTDEDDSESANKGDLNTQFVRFSSGHPMSYSNYTFSFRELSLPSTYQTGNYVPEELKLKAFLDFVIDDSRFVATFFDEEGLLVTSLRCPATTKQYEDFGNALHSARIAWPDVVESYHAHLEASPPEEETEEGTHNPKFKCAYPAKDPPPRRAKPSSDSGHARVRSRQHENQPKLNNFRLDFNIRVEMMNDENKDVTYMTLEAAVKNVRTWHKRRGGSLRASTAPMLTPNNSRFLSAEPRAGARKPFQFVPVQFGGSCSSNYRDDVGMTKYKAAASTNYQVKHPGVVRKEVLKSCGYTDQGKVRSTPIDGNIDADDFMEVFNHETKEAENSDAEYASGDDAVFPFEGEEGDMPPDEPPARYRPPPVGRGPLTSLKSRLSKIKDLTVSGVGDTKQNTENYQNDIRSLLRTSIFPNVASTGTGPVTSGQVDKALSIIREPSASKQPAAVASAAFVTVGTGPKSSVVFIPLLTITDRPLARSGWIPELDDDDATYLDPVITEMRNATLILKMDKAFSSGARATVAGVANLIVSSMKSGTKEIRYVNVTQDNVSFAEGDIDGNSFNLAMYMALRGAPLGPTLTGGIDASGLLTPVGEIAKKMSLFQAPDNKFPHNPLIFVCAPGMQHDSFIPADYAAGSILNKILIASNAGRYLPNLIVAQTLMGVLCYYLNGGFKRQHNPTKEQTATADQYFAAQKRTVSIGSQVISMRKLTAALADEQDEELKAEGQAKLIELKGKISDDMKTMLDPKLLLKIKEPSESYKMQERVKGASATATRNLGEVRNDKTGTKYFITKDGKKTKKIGKLPGNIWKTKEGEVKVTDRMSQKLWMDENLKGRALKYYDGKGQFQIVFAPNVVVGTAPKSKRRQNAEDLGDWFDKHVGKNEEKEL